MHSFLSWEQSLKGIRPSSPAWRTIIGAINGDDLSDEERDLYARLTGRTVIPEGGASEAIVIGGRRGGKSESAARWLVHQALFGGHEIALAPGQKGVLAVISPERAMSKEILAYCKGLARHPSVKKSVAHELEESIEFKNRLVIKILSADSTSVRSGTIVAAVLDEWCFAPHEPSADPDVAIVEALRPGMAPVRGAPPRRMIVISSAGVRDGWVYDTIQASHGKDDAAILTAIATTEQLNPSIDQKYLAKRKAANPRTFEREHLSIFSDVITNGWFGHETLTCSIDRGRSETPYVDGLRYTIAVDAATERDAWAVCVATTFYRYADEAKTRKERRTEVVYSRAWLPKPGQPLDVRAMISETRKICERYGTARIHLDQWNSATLIEMFRDRQIKAIKVPWTASGDESKYERYSRVRDALRDGSLRLPDDAALLSELGNVRGTALPTGGERLEASIGHDDLASACVMASSIALASTPTWPNAGPGRESTWDREHREEQQRRLMLAVYGCG